MPTPDQVRAAAENHAKLFSSADKEGWLDLYADNAEFADPYPAPASVGRAGLVEFWDRVHGMASNYSFDNVQIVTAGDRAAMTFTLSMELDGTRYGFDGVDVFEVDDDGKIARFTAYWDPTAVRPL